MDREKTVMLQEIGMQPEFVGKHIDPMLESMRTMLRDRIPGSIRNGFMIGCGDSYCAALAVRSFMMKATGRWVEPVESLEFSRYLVGDLPADSFVFGVSNSGTVSRTIEGVRLAREMGAWTFAVTVSDQSTLARTAETFIKAYSPPNIKESPDGTKVITPGTISYTASMLALYVASVAFGEKLGLLAIAQVRELIAELRAVASHMAAADEAVKKLCEDVASDFTPDRKVVILGGGPNYATAYFGMAKFFEALRQPSHCAELEEWAHEHYFITDEATDTIILLPAGAGRERGLEQARAARDVGSRVYIIGPKDDLQAASAADIYFPMPIGIREALTPFVYKVPFEYLTCQIAVNRKVSFLGFDDPNRQKVNFRQIFDSKQSQLAEGPR
jgi:glucosamine--fructose-6-phosphate aminotransferase (isomerizing)